MPADSPKKTFADKPVAVIGGGLAGCECALALAAKGWPVTLHEQKPAAFSPAHTSPGLAELVCSNSFRSNDASSSGVGLLKEEMRKLGSAIMAVAEKTAVPAGKALAVDRDKFSAAITALVEQEPLLTIARKEIKSFADPELEGKIVVVAAGPLISSDLAASLGQIMGRAASGEHLYFYDAIAPIVSAESINMDIAFRGSRYDGEPPQEDAANAGDYLNCPMNKDEYTAFYTALLAADKVAPHAFEREVHFEGCMPIEALAGRGEKTLAFGPLKPVGFTDPRTGKRPWALLQLRAENTDRTAYNMVGCQTKMTQAAQKKIFQMIPGLEQADFLRFGSMHRNTYVDAPRCLQADLSLKARPDIFLAGQLTGVEGYVESAASGLWLGLSLAARLHGREISPPPPCTALGALLRHLQTPAKHFQPSNAHFGLMPELEQTVHKKSRKQALAERARQEFGGWMATAW